MRIKLWGVRGSIPAPINQNDLKDRLTRSITLARDLFKENPDISTDEVLSRIPESVRVPVGGETTCVEIQSGDSQLIIDMGSGARRLGYEMAARSNDFKEVHILMTHTHWDHIQGWPFFIPAYMPDKTIHFYSAIEDCEDRYTLQQKFEFFPVAFSEMPSKKEFHYFKSGDFLQVGPFKIQTISLPHPGGSIAYRIQSNGKKLIVSTDTEFYGPNLDQEVRNHSPVFQDADLLILDAQYTLEEAERRIGWGHTSMEVAVNVALQWNVKRLVFTHHEPAHSDETIYKMYEEARSLLHSLKGDTSEMELDLGVEGAVYQL